jgi:catechol 2,3-dioxygenase-like lactoylglutathione lyase family enzyme
MKIYLTSIFVDDQAKALDFYTRVLGFAVKHDVSLGKYRWLTLVEKDNPDSIELLLEPNEHPAVQPFRDALRRDGIPAASFQVDDVDAEYRRLRGLGVAFRRQPMTAGPVRMAVLDDTCGNLIQLVGPATAG